MKGLTCLTRIIFNVYTSCTLYLCNFIIEHVHCGNQSRLTCLNKKIFYPSIYLSTTSHVLLRGKMSQIIYPTNSCESKWLGTQLSICSKFLKNICGGVLSDVYHFFELHVYGLNARVCFVYKCHLMTWNKLARLKFYLFCVLKRLKPQSLTKATSTHIKIHLHAQTFCCGCS